MNNAIQFEDRASSSRSKHEGESSSSLCDRLSRTRATSQRQLPTDHDYAVSTREYQTDQSSPNPAPTAACPVLERRNKKRQKQPHRCAEIDRSLHIRDELIKHSGPVLAGIVAVRRPVLHDVPPAKEREELKAGIRKRNAGIGKLVFKDRVLYAGSQDRKSVV